MTRLRAPRDGAGTKFPGSGVPLSPLLLEKLVKLTTKLTNLEK